MRGGMVASLPAIPEFKRGHKVRSILDGVLSRLSSSNNQERGATAIEYAIMAAFIAVVIFGSVTLFGAAVTGLFGTFNTTWP